MKITEAIKILTNNYLEDIYKYEIIDLNNNFLWQYLEDEFNKNIDENKADTSFIQADILACIYIELNEARGGGVSSNSSSESLSIGHISYNINNADSTNKSNVLLLAEGKILTYSKNPENNSYLFNVKSFDCGC